jgi:hypothetical protein
VPHGAQRGLGLVEPEGRVDAVLAGQLVGVAQVSVGLHGGDCRQAAPQAGAKLRGD